LVDAGGDGGGFAGTSGAGADILLTMLSDGPAVQAVMAGADGPLASSERDMVWLQMSTVALTGTDRLATLARAHGNGVRRRPGLGAASARPRRAHCSCLQSGRRKPTKTVAPVLDAIGRRTVWLALPGAAAGQSWCFNNWLVDLVESTAETLQLRRGPRYRPGAD